jgi:hypothetical protein
LQRKNFLLTVKKNELNEDDEITIPCGTRYCCIEPINAYEDKLKDRAGESYAALVERTDEFDDVNDVKNS